MKILGLATMGSSAAAIVIDGKVVAAVEEERLTRIKNDGGFPFQAIAECLHMAGCSMAEIDLIAVYWQPWRITTRALAVLKQVATSPSHAHGMLKRVRDIFLSTREREAAYPEMRGKWSDLFRLKPLLRQHFGPFNAPVRFFDHHLTHAASIYPISGFSEAICLTYDGGGENLSTVISHIREGRQTILKKVKWPNSLGHYYSAFTGFLGFRMLEGEYKMMGLAPYGTPRYKDVILQHILRLEPDGCYILDQDILNYHNALDGIFSDRLRKLLGPERERGAPFTQRHKDIAASVQAAFEEALLHMMRWAKEAYPHVRQACIAGGCGLNVTANGRLIQSGLFDEILIPPAPHDAGCAIGAALLGAHDGQLPAYQQESMPHPYLGRSFSDEDIRQAFASLGLVPPPPATEEELINSCAEILAQGGVVAWFQGGAEFGPRALGNRSFLADPRDDGIREVLNAKIKKRELFRPFAPSVMLEHAATYFELDQESPYMNIVARVRPEKKKDIPAVTHVDGTARVHTVSRTANPRYWKLLEAFRQKTGVAVLLNTSFNIQEPIVYSPQQAINTFLKSDVDALAIGNHLVTRDQIETAGATRT